MVCDFLETIEPPPKVNEEGKERAVEEKRGKLKSEGKFKTVGQAT